MEDGAQALGTHHAQDFSYPHSVQEVGRELGYFCWVLAVESIHEESHESSNGGGVPGRIRMDLDGVQPPRFQGPIQMLSDSRGRWTTGETMAMRPRFGVG